MTLLRFLLAALLGLVAAAPGFADELRPGYLDLTEMQPRHWRMVWKAPVLGGLATHSRPSVPDFCAVSPPTAHLAGASVVSESIVVCSRDLADNPVGLAGMEASYTDALVRIAPLGRPVQAARLTPQQPFVTVSATPKRWDVARNYFGIGVEHILMGWDHLLFVIALVLLLGRLGSVVKAATAFTIAHSITLAGTTMGLFGLPQAPVEALIALSIVFLAVEIAKKRDDVPRLSERVPWIVAFLFGLIHGFGFAGALREIGLPEGEVPMALLTFNLGVEAGQLAVVALVLGVIAAARRFAPAMLRPATLAATYAIGTLASFWFIERMIG